jgi:hypothetical protein
MMHNVGASQEDMDAVLHHVHEHVRAKGGGQSMINGASSTVEEAGKKGKADYSMTPS